MQYSVVKKVVLVESVIFLQTNYSLNCVLQHLLHFTVLAHCCKENHVVHIMFCFIGSHTCRLGCVMDSCGSTTYRASSFSKTRLRSYFHKTNTFSL